MNLWVFPYGAGGVFICGAAIWMRPIDVLWHVSRLICFILFVQMHSHVTGPYQMLIVLWNIYLRIQNIVYESCSVSNTENFMLTWKNPLHDYVQMPNNLSGNTVYNVAYYSAIIHYLCLAFIMNGIDQVDVTSSEIFPGMISKTLRPSRGATFILWNRWTGIIMVWFLWPVRPARDIYQLWEGHFISYRVRLYARNVGSYSHYSASYSSFLLRSSLCHRVGNGSLVINM